VFTGHQIKRLPGQYYDTETNLHYNYFRDYDPIIGRYIQSDPIGLSGGLNTFTYVDNQPLGYSDPKGLVKWTGSVTYASWTIAPKVKGRRIPLTNWTEITLEVKSKCENGKIAEATIIVSNIDSESWIHLPIGGMRASVELEDGLSTPNPYALQGGFSLESWNGLGAFGSIEAGSASGTFMGIGGLGLYKFKGTGNFPPYYTPKITSCNCDE
jgi:RHS repeat-associated protein